uniref:Serpin domain-containing protein n=1 Tax=Anolis carolinensis TaxID=28377 RepID=A0A803TW12_ANOCA
MNSLPEANLKFAIDTYHKLREEHPHDNLLFAPVNATSALGLLAMASGHEQAAKIEKVLHWDEVKECDTSRNRRYLEAVESIGLISARVKVGMEKFELSSPDNLHPLSDFFPSVQKFISNALNLYRTDVEGINLKNAPEEVRGIINHWVEAQTQDKIKDLLLEDSFDCHAQLLQLNALYLKGQWKVKFNKDLTVEAPFYSHYAAKNDCQTVQLMNRNGIYNTATFDVGDTEVQVLEIPFKDNELSLYVMLPTDSGPEALKQLEDSLTHEHLLDWASHLKPELVDLFIPKFSLEKKFYLNQYLDLHDLSDPKKADFSQATTTEGVTLTQLVHDAFLEINEEGCEEVEDPRLCRDRRSHRKALEFMVDHPFLYFVHHKCTQSIILFGKFSKPE